MFTFGWLMQEHYLTCFHTTRRPCSWRLVTPTRDIDFTHQERVKTKVIKLFFKKKTKSLLKITVRLAQLKAIKSSFPYRCKYLSYCTGLSVSTQTRHFCVMLKKESTGLSARYTQSYTTSVREVINWVS